MAATPPMPPGANHLQLNGNSQQQQQQQPQQTPNIAEALQQHFQLKALQQQRSNNNSLSSSHELLLLEAPATPTATPSSKAKPNCSCTNISIMHLFHEMKQEFPTLPDALVTQCVNENCHQRENCIQMLKKELVLHPSPVQSYPAKVLQQQQQRQAKPPTPLKPLRAAPTTPPTPAARQRPTTLNLARQSNSSLQLKIQRQQQQQRREALQPLRRAPPLPPLPPKPQTPGAIAVSFASSSSNCSNDSSCLTSPLSSSESELSLNIALSSPTTSAATPAATTAQLRSPVRHRSVITLQPEPPYARDFLTNNNNGTPTQTPPSPSTPSSGRKSFTSLNLTLRQPPAANSGAVPATIDITAGPAPCFTYSSSSFDARRGTHKNFQLTVTDEGSVFSAGCVRPQLPPYAPVPALAADGATPPHCPMTRSNFSYPTQPNQNHVVASNFDNNHSADSSPSVTHMPLYEGVLPECDQAVHAATIERQKARRDKLANALRENKKRLLSLEQEINILTEPVPAGESERLDRDIKKLTDDCQRLLNMINDGTAAAPMARQVSSSAAPRQRATRQQQPPSSLRLHSVPAPATSVMPLDYQQHSSAPSSACLTPQQQLQLQLEPPPTYAQYYQFQQFLQQQRNAAAAAAAAAQSPHPQLNGQAAAASEEEEDGSLSDSEADEGDEPLDMWACNLCTFRNHPQLNVCEACENVRIQPAPIYNREDMDIHITLSPGENRIIHSWIRS
ncbi:ataxin-2 homolog [Drosophila busckii]|uniref:ataxin-2 homolog n=1 Tax=Drosophila busckii TaxID=30019 RepID=UPI00143318B8|nr:ataxin-2 homolog [Drosophila busckii]